MTVFLECSKTLQNIQLFDTCQNPLEVMYLYTLTLNGDDKSTP